MSDALSPVDGRYAQKLDDLRETGLTERKLIETKLFVECEWLNWLVQNDIIPTQDVIDGPSRTSLRELLKDIPENYVDAAVKHEEILNHDTKAAELAVKDALRALGLGGLQEYVHFGLTSEDITNVAYALMILNTWDQVMVPCAVKLITALEGLASKFALSPMLGMTHGQPASPTTFGKEEGVFVYRLKSQQICSPRPIHVKFGGGATGCFSALTTAFPFTDWVEQSAKFVGHLHPRLKHDTLTTQVSNRESLAEYLHLIIRFNNVLYDLCQDHWLYCSRRLLKLAAIKEEVGSSTMPHKVNPIHFENAEGNLELANSLLNLLTTRLTRSRMQRDLTDSTVIRNLGVAFAHSLLSWKSILTGLQRISFDQEQSMKELLQHWEVLAEPVQTTLRKYPAVKDPYTVLKELTRQGNKLEREDYLNFVNTFCRPIVDEDDYSRLMKLSPDTYIGVAPELAVLAANLPIHGGAKGGK
eukprot:Protomagalhaensia_sp_Gyna_25__1115@NODE_1544_length_1751_cov_8_297313_g1252_i0_p1_GENE_NODE_1544_length_1751_cov_8_297313_g1252_i0NODE_1544_length_1751_cov_8_297313_g1252_i0_p1_ORF_typecomplete_len481_score61_82Lyase_1/PF00206_20/5_2e48ASL_C/PF08328_11/9_7e34_NODE_1544_length_1751_cov_8_297313_g1252_i03081723